MRPRCKNNKWISAVHNSPRFDRVLDVCVCVYRGKTVVYDRAVFKNRHGSTSSWLHTIHDARFVLLWCAPDDDDDDDADDDNSRRAGS